MGKFKDLLESLNIDEKFNKRIHKQKEYNHVKDNVPLVEDYNMMADLLYLPAYNGYKYLFVIVDLASDEFDIEPIKNKEPETVLKAMLKCFKRGYISKPEYTLKTDGGKEFKGVFNKYLYDESILHKTAIPDRHKSLSNVESLNKQLARLFNGYMNAIEVKTGKVYRNWITAVPFVREQLNNIRKKKLPENINSYEYPVPNDTKQITKDKIKIDKNGKKTIVKETKNIRIGPKFKIDQMVYRALEAPRNALDKAQPTKNFREGDYTFDRVPRRIVNIITMGGDGPLYRYCLEGLNNVSYSENELMKA
jgi:hypothetical protein